MDWDAILLIALKILAVLVLVLLNGFFVAAEFALVRVRETQLDALVAKGQRRAKLARHIVRNLNSYLSATQLGITMASLGLGWMGQPVFASLLSPLLDLLGVKSGALVHSISFVVGFSVLTFLSIVVGELAPKWLTIQKTLPIALWAARPLHWFYLAFYPFNRLLNLAARGLLRQIGIEPDAETSGAQSEEELRLALASVAQGRMTFGRNIVLNALDLRRRVAREVMRPRQEITAFDTEASIADCLALAEQTRYSRFPLCEGGDLDRTRGVVHVKDLYTVARASRPSVLEASTPQSSETHGRDARATTGADLLPVARKLVYVPETGRLEKLLQLFLERKLHFAIVVDEYGGTVGIVTLENVLEELVGQIQDEFDEEKPEWTRVAENVWEASGALPLHELEKLVGEIGGGEGAATASGWITQRLGGFPRVGDALTVGACELRVEEMDGPRVARFKITRR
ncbi:MAG TPA: hemolysin family protein [Verrucomicrobiae bacterium]|nr:hemolysin family protein [Verrucomicrobiae bacterium]